MISRITWFGYRFFERLGIAGILGFSTMILSLLFYWLACVPQRAELNELNVSKVRPMVVTQAPDEEDILREFVNRFPKSVERASSIQKMMTLAESQGLVLNEVTYKSEHRQDDLLNHYQMDFSMISTYPEARRFLSTLLAQMPNVSLDSLTMTRDDVNHESIETRVRLTLHFSS